MKYRVGWINFSTNASGHGEPLDPELAVAWRDWANAEYPDITHYVEAIESDQANDREEVQPKT